MRALWTVAAKTDSAGRASRETSVKLEIRDSELGGQEKACREVETDVSGTAVVAVTGVVNVSGIAADTAVVGLSPAGSRGLIVGEASTGGTAVAVVRAAVLEPWLRDERGTEVPDPSSPAKIGVASKAEPLAADTTGATA